MLSWSPAPFLRPAAEASPCAVGVETDAAEGPAGLFSYGTQLFIPRRPVRSICSDEPNGKQAARRPRPPAAGPEVRVWDESS